MGLGLIWCTAALAIPRDAGISPQAPTALKQDVPMAAVQCVAGNAGPYPCENVDLLAFMPLNNMDCGSGNDIWGWTDPATGTEYALMGCNNGTSFVDLSDPENPVYLGRLPTHTSNSTWRDIKVYSHYAFIGGDQAGEHGLQVFDLNRLGQVTNPPVEFTEDAHYDGFGKSHNIVINTDSGYAFAVGSNTCNAGLHMVNIQDPLNPTNAGCFSADGYTHDAQCVIYQGPDSQYAGREICLASNEDTLTIVDVTNKSNPRQIAIQSYAGVAYTHQAWLTEDHRYLLLDDELDESGSGHNTRTYIWDVTNLDSPTLIGTYTATTAATDHNQYVKGSYTYQSNYRAGLRILDISDVANGNLQEAGFFDVYPSNDDTGFNGTWSNYPYFDSGIVIVSGIEQGLFVLQPNLPEIAPSVSIADARVLEGDSGTATVQFKVSLFAASDSEVTVAYATADASADEGTDYLAANDTLTFPPGTIHQTLSVTVFGDADDELTESFFLNLSSPVNATLGDGQALGDIVDDDRPTPAVTVGDVEIQEGDDGTINARIFVQLSTGADESGVTVDYAVIPGTAAPGEDYQPQSGTLTFTFGSLVRDVIIPISGDVAEEPPETFFLDLSNVSGATLADPQGEVTILNDDTVSVDALNPSAGAAAGGVVVSITGQNFQPGADVSFGETHALDVQVPSETEILATTPALSPGQLYPVHIHPPGGGHAPTPMKHPLHKNYLADFLDVGAGHIFHDRVEILVRNQVTVGCGNGNYCPASAVTRAQMAVFLLRGFFGGNYTPPACVGVFDDVACPGAFADWIEELAVRGITVGCGGGNYCPNNPVTRAQMAVFLLRTAEGDAYQPPACSAGAELFGDVPAASGFCPWIEELARREITGGCGNGNYCPGQAVTRGQMAVFLGKTFNLPFVP